MGSSTQFSRLLLALHNILIYKKIHASRDFEHDPQVLGSCSRRLQTPFSSGCIGGQYKAGPCRDDEGRIHETSKDVSCMTKARVGSRARVRSEAEMRSNAGGEGTNKTQQDDDPGDMLDIQRIVEYPPSQRSERDQSLAYGRGHYNGYVYTRPKQPRCEAL